jgi:regulator of protease activity HflC (stomatin/prohibitin superfamily)
MKKITLLIIAGLFALTTFTGCSPRSVDQGQEGVAVNKPYFIGSEGINMEPFQVGRSWQWFSTDMVFVDSYAYTKDLVFDDLITSDNNPVDFKVHLTMQLIKGQSPILIRDFGEEWYNKKFKEIARNYVRNFTKSHTMFDMTTSAVTTIALQEFVFENMKRFLKEEKIPMILMKVAVGKVMAPKKVIEETVRTAVEKQKVITQQERVKAEQARIEAEKASAQADKAYRTEMGYTTTEYLKNKELDIIDRKDNVIIITGSESGKAMIPVNTQTK